MTFKRFLSVYNKELRSSYVGGNFMAYALMMWKKSKPVPEYKRAEYMAQR